MAGAAQVEIAGAAQLEINGAAGLVINGAAEQEDRRGDESAGAANCAENTGAE